METKMNEAIAWVCLTVASQPWRKVFKVKYLVLTQQSIT